MPFHLNGLKLSCVGRWEMAEVTTQRSTRKELQLHWTPNLQRTLMWEPFRRDRHDDSQPHAFRPEVRMPRVSERQNVDSPSRNGNERRNVLAAPTMLSPQTAWRALCRRTGGGISRATFYRWVSSGKLYSVRLGFQIYIPQIALDDLVKHCLDGDRF